MARQRIDGQCFPQLREFRIGCDEPCAALDGQFGGESVRIPEIVPLLQRSNPRGSFPIHFDDGNGKFKQSIFNLPGGSFAVASPGGVKDFAPIHGRHKEWRALAESLCYEAFNLSRGNLAVFKEADQCVCVEHVKSPAAAKRCGGHLLLLPAFAFAFAFALSEMFFEHGWLTGLGL